MITLSICIDQESWALLEQRRAKDKQFNLSKFVRDQIKEAMRDGSAPESDQE